MLCFVCTQVIGWEGKWVTQNAYVVVEGLKGMDRGNEEAGQRSQSPL